MLEEYIRTLRLHCLDLRSLIYLIGEGKLTSARLTASTRARAWTRYKASDQAVQLQREPQQGQHMDRNKWSGACAVQSSAGLSPSYQRSCQEK